MIEGIIIIIGRKWTFWACRIGWGYSVNCFSVYVVLSLCFVIVVCYFCLDTSSGIIFLILIRIEGKELIVHDDNVPSNSRHCVVSVLVC